MSCNEEPTRSAIAGRRGGDMASLIRTLSCAEVL
eukprot:CAMPEP_0179297136 /NCGR_PEP_ID=MMETSP0797-20121207/45303_1 /TAXON_ID=47934 /ORGANISM="Dinophysis acuminata, Strain DAEP01" /LENGTH=33 /DNA_ID= /DNA_START= /DNA_END= /DNA_ORIENTATION=